MWAYLAKLTAFNICEIIEYPFFNPAMIFDMHICKVKLTAKTAAIQMASHEYRVHIWIKKGLIKLKKYLFSALLNPNVYMKMIYNIKDSIALIIKIK